MKASKNAIDLIAEFEGCYLTAYLCPAKVWTIGFGHTAGVRKGDTITKAQAVEMLYTDVVEYENAVNRLITVPLTQNQFDALVSFTFNLGETNLKNSTMRRLINQRNYLAGANQLLLWDKAKGVKLKGLTRRRNAERDLFLK